MVVIVVNDDGKVERIKCRKIEPATLSKFNIIVDEDYVIDIRNVIKIVEG